MCDFYHLKIYILHILIISFALIAYWLYYSLGIF